MRRPEEALMTDASARPTPAKFAAWLCLGLYVLGIDQATKIWFEQNFSLGEVLPVCTGFNLVLAHNTGAAFSFLADAGGWQRWAFAALAAAVIVAMIVLLVRNSHRKLLSLSLTLIAAGALGNMIDLNEGLETKRIPVPFLLPFTSRKRIPHKFFQLFHPH